jgi:protein-S-isoprenylcysteine O-methyltransferase Ste14
MLPVFAQFAGVMFFLAGLGGLNILWLPVLDISFKLQRLGLVIRAPYDLLMWLLRQAGIHGYWPIVYFFLGTGLLLFFFGTFAWLSARSRNQPVAGFLVYRISRHPQYLGWILWSYGVYLLLLQGLYPRRSWGIDASLPWLVSTMTIIGVAMLEELNMLGRYGETYEAYRRKTPFLLPLPAPLNRLFTLPLRLVFHKRLPERKREVAFLVVFYGVALVGASYLFYAGGWEKAEALFRPSRQAERMAALAARLEAEPDGRAKFFIAGDLADRGDPAGEYFLAALESEQAEVRKLAADYFRKKPYEKALPALTAALDDPVTDVRVRALKALAAAGARTGVEPMLGMLDDPDPYIRNTALRCLAEMGIEDIVDRAAAVTKDPERWNRMSAVRSLGILGSARAVPALIESLNDEASAVRREAVIALYKIGSPGARDALMAALHDEDWEVRLYAAEAVKSLNAE